MTSLKHAGLAFLAGALVASSARAGTIIWNGPPTVGTNNNWSLNTDWLGGTVPGGGDDVKFYDLGGVTAGSINNTVDSSFAGTIGSLQYGNTNNAHTTFIPAGLSLSITNTNGLTVGTLTDNGSAQIVTATIVGGGTLIVSNPAANILVDQGRATSGNGTQRATLDLSGLTNFSATVSRIGVGTTTLGGANNAQNATGTLKLGQTNVITTTFPGTAITNGVTATPTNAIEVGSDNGNTGGVNFLYLGESSTFFIDSIGVGNLKTTSSMLFSPNLSSPVANFNGTNGAGSRIRFWTIADMSSSGSSSGSCSGTNDFTGGTVNAFVDTMSLGRDRSQGNTGTAVTKGTFTFTAGTVDVNTLYDGNEYFGNSGNSNPMAGVINVSGPGAVLKVNTVLNLGFTATNSTAGLKTTGTLNITNGSVYASTIAVGKYSTTNVISLTNGTLIVTNSLATNGTGLFALNVTNSTLGFTIVDGTPKALAATVNAGGATNLIQLASVAVFGSYPQIIPLLQYTTLNGANNFGLAGAVASAPGAYLTNLTTSTPKSIALVLPANPIPVITSGPFGYSGNPGDNVTTNFAVTVAAASVTPQTFTWYYYAVGGPTNALANGPGPSGTSTLSGATTANLQVANAQAGDNGNYFAVVSNAYGMATSSVAILNLSSGCVSPMISGPTSQTVLQGNNATFSASVTANPAAYLQWQRNGANIPGANTSTLVVSNVQYPADDQAVFSLIATNGCGDITNSATLTVIVPPVITSQPVNLVVTNGNPASFTVGATGVPSPSYQWYKNNVAILTGANPTATSATFSIAATSPSDTATYYVQVFNSAGASNSVPVTLTVNSSMSATSLSPGNGATGVCYDTPLYLTFNQPPTLDNKFKIRIYNVTNGAAPVDTIDLTLNSTAGYQAHSPFPGDSQAFNYFPVIITGNTAAIYPHGGVMTSNQTYYVTIDDGAFTDASGAYFAGVTAGAWQFTTKQTGPANATNLVVAQDYSGDFATIQGAVDSIPLNNSNYTLVNIHNGTYTEIVDVSSKNNITFRGQNRTNTVQGYANNANVAPGGSTHARMAFKVNSKNLAIENMTVMNTTPQGGSQAEALMIETGASQFILNNAEVDSRQDTVLANVNSSQGYFYNSLVTGNFDYLWGGGNMFITNCEIRTLAGTGTPNLAAPRTDNGATGNWAGYSGLLVSNGYSFVKCQLTRQNSSVTNCSMSDGNGSANGLASWTYCTIDTSAYTNALASAQSSQLLWEYGDVDLNSNLLTSAASPFLGFTQLNVGDARLTAVTNATIWLNGWTPQLAPNILTQPVSLSVAGGASATFNVTATGVPDPTYQWYKNGTPISGATGAAYNLPAAYAGDAASYTVVVTTSAGSVTSSPATLTVGNTAPTLGSVTNQTVNVGTTVSVSDAASDPDVPPQTLSYLPISPPAGAAISPGGLFTWRPTVAAAGTVNTVIVVATDNGTPPLSATNAFTITVNPLTQPTLGAPGFAGGQFSLTVSGQVGPDYELQSTTNLTSGIWVSVLTNTPTASPFILTDANAGGAQKFYRIVVGPPVP